MIDSCAGKGKCTELEEKDKSRQGKREAALDALRAADAAWLKAYRVRCCESGGERGAMLAPNAPVLSGGKSFVKFIVKSFTQRIKLYARDSSHRKPSHFHNISFVRSIHIVAYIMIRLAAGPDGRFLRVERGGRKVRTPQSSVPDNVREGGFKPVRRKVPQRTYRPHFLGLVPKDQGKGEKVR
jgi:hypothetical protein